MNDPHNHAQRPIAVIVTGHFYDQKRRGSIHWLTDEFLKNGWKVRFVTVGYSQISKLIGDIRLKALDTSPAKGRRRLSEQLETYFHIPPFHPIDLRLRPLNKLATPIFRLYPRLVSRWLTELVNNADLVVLESGIPLLLAPLVRRSSAARLIYRVNDDVRAMRSPPILHEAELALAPLFDRISLASPILARRFEGLGQVGIDPMGLNKPIFDAAHPDPYTPRWEKEVVCAGTSHFDTHSMLMIARSRPTWRFHVIGRLRQSLKADNIVAHGEMPFQALVPFIQHADYAVAPYNDVPGMEYQAHHSNRLLQYAYVGLPTLVPQRVYHEGLELLVPYRSNNDRELDHSLTILSTTRRNPNPKIPGWDRLYNGIAGKVHAE